MTFNANRWLELTANFGGNYGTPEIANVLGVGINAKTNTHTFLFGPTVTYRNKSRWTPFTHALFGVARAQLSDVSALGTTAPGALTDQGFAMAAGGGVDVHMNKFMTTRVAEVDWVRTSVFDNTQNHVRVTTGLVFSF